MMHYFLVMPEGAGVLCFVITAGFWTTKPDSFMHDVHVGFQVVLRIHLVSTNVTFILQFQMLGLNVISQNSHSRCFILALWAGNCCTLVYVFNMAGKSILDGK